MECKAFTAYFVIFDYKYNYLYLVNGHSISRKYSSKEVLDRPWIMSQLLYWNSLQNAQKEAGSWVPHWYELSLYSVAHHLQNEKTPVMHLPVSEYVAHSINWRGYFFYLNFYIYSNVKFIHPYVILIQISIFFFIFLLLLQK